MMDINDLKSFAEQAMADGKLAKLEQPYAQTELRCVSPPMGCGRPLRSGLSTAFRDQSSRDEYRLTGMCQDCQDKLFDACLSPEDIADMESHPEYFGRCPDCGRYCELQHVDVGVGVMSGFDCCYLYDPRPARCTETPGCHLGVGHLYGCDNK